MSTTAPALNASISGDPSIDAIDRRIIAAAQGGLPRVREPYHAIAAQLGLDPVLVMRRLKHMIETGVVRRIAAVPNHYAVGYTANGMSVWDIPDDTVRDIGRQVGGLSFVSHCYHRPRHLPQWPYNLFAMVHGHTRKEVEQKVEHIAALLGPVDRGHAVLYSKRILKKTGLRIGE